VDNPRVPRRIAACLLACALFACARGRDQAAPLVVAVHSDPISLDPHLQNEVLTFGILANVYDGLTSLEPDLKVRANLVTTWENPDERTWRFHLRPDARFSDNRPVEAEDVRFSLERARKHPQSQLASYLVEVASVRAIDPATVEVVTRRPFAPLLNKLSFIYIVPRGSPEEITAPIGSGTYRVVRYEKGRSLLLTPNGRDEDRRPLEFVFMPSAAARVDALLAGRVDLAQDVPPGDVERIQKHGERVASRPSTVVEYLHFRAGDPRFTDIRVRKAVNLALDRKKLVAVSTGGLGRPATQLVGPGIFGYDPSIPATERDLPEARRLLAEAGHPDGLEVTLETRAGRDPTEIARQLEEAGFKVKLEVRPWPELYGRLSRGEVPFYYGGVAAVTADASDVFDSHVHTRAGGYGNTNYARYSSPEVDRLIEESGTAMQPDVRRGLLQHCMRRLAEDLVFLPLVIREDLYGIRPGVAWEPRPDRMLLGREMKPTK
jgi:peptide/nickel transport system substrate-binding protein